MSTDNWSEGPWAYKSEMILRSDGQEMYYWDVVDSNGLTICEVLTDHIGQQEANAYLITAAPKLYNVLKEWDEKDACGCDTATCQHTCLPARTRHTLAEACGGIK